MAPAGHGTGSPSGLAFGSGCHSARPLCGGVRAAPRSSDGLRSPLARKVSLFFSGNIIVFFPQNNSSRCRRRIASH